MQASAPTMSNSERATAAAASEADAQGLPSAIVATLIRVVLTTKKVEEMTIAEVWTSCGSNNSSYTNGKRKEARSNSKYGGDNDSTTTKIPVIVEAGKAAPTASARQSYSRDCRKNSKCCRNQQIYGCSCKNSNPQPKISAADIVCAIFKTA